MWLTVLLASPAKIDDHSLIEGGKWADKNGKWYKLLEYAYVSEDIPINPPEMTLIE